MPALSVIIPTANRLAILGETLARLEAQAAEVDFDVIVVDDGSTDGTLEALTERAPGLPFPLRLERQAQAGPAAARNRALALTRAPVCLFIDDDSWPHPGLLRRHRDFHARHPEPEAALLGRIDTAPDPPPTPFMLWRAGVHLGFDQIEDDQDVEGLHFYTGNASVKTELLRRCGGFDESQVPSHEDTDLGLRLKGEGMRLVFDPEAVVDHYQPADLESTIRRMRRIGRSLARLVERHPSHPVPRPPGVRHRVKAAALTGLTLAGVRTTALRHETWRFLCHEATREGFWAAARSDGEAGDPVEGVRIGRRLAALAVRDQDAQMPAERPIDRRPVPEIVTS